MGYQHSIAAWCKSATIGSPMVYLFTALSQNTAKIALI